jgi:hypothetical protein
MKNTRAYVAEVANSECLLPVQIDGIPDGFVFLREGITIGGVTSDEHYVIFIPNSEGTRVEANANTKADDLLNLYDKAR